MVLISTFEQKDLYVRHHYNIEQNSASDEFLFNFIFIICCFMYRTRPISSKHGTHVQIACKITVKSKSSSKLYVGVMGSKKVLKNRSFRLPNGNYLHVFWSQNDLCKKLKLRFHLQCSDYDWGKFHNNQLFGDRSICSYFHC